MIEFLSISESTRLLSNAGSGKFLTWLGRRLGKALTVISDRLGNLPGAAFLLSNFEVRLLVSDMPSDVPNRFTFGNRATNSALEGGNLSNTSITIKVTNTLSIFIAKVEEDPEPEE